MEQTVIINSQECGFTFFNTLGKTIFGCGMKGGIQKLYIKRVIVVAENSRRKYGFLSRAGLAPAEFIYDVDVDIYLEDDTVIQVHSSESGFLKKLLPYVWELNEDPREAFYRTQTRRR